MAGSPSSSQSITITTAGYPAADGRPCEDGVGAAWRRKGSVGMSRVVVIGATGHIGTYLVPRLVDSGQEVIAVSRGTRGPYHASPQWDAVTAVTADREAEDAGERSATGSRRCARRW